MSPDPTAATPGAHRYLAAIALAALALGGACARSSRPPLTGIVLTPVVSGLEEPTAGTLQPGTDRMFIAERHGTVRVIADGEILGLPAVDLADDIEVGFADQGLLGIAFHPRYPDDRRVFLSYTEVDTEAQVVFSFLVSPDGTTFDADSGIEVIRAPQPFDSHQGGTIRFGPDGMLWAAFGDGGFVPPDTGSRESQDSLRHGQNPYTLPGTVVRLDVDSAIPYAIPPDNPFRDGVAGLPEVWLYGVRSPWSLWFDSDFVIVGDVGNLGWEEINRLERGRDAGANLGWSDMEGPDCFREPDCAAAETTVLPWLPLPHADACAVIVGPVYRGLAMPELVGELLFTDLCTGWIRSVPIGSAPDDPTEWLPPSGETPTAFIVGPDDEVYLTTFAGALYRLDGVR